MALHFQYDESHSSYDLLQTAPKLFSAKITIKNYFRVPSRLKKVHT